DAERHQYNLGAKQRHAAHHGGERRRGPGVNGVANGRVQAHGIAARHLAGQPHEKHQRQGGDQAVPYHVYFAVAGMAAPSRNSSVARRTTMSPGCKLPMTSIRSPPAAPFLTSTHSARPFWLRMTKVRSV